MKKSMKLLPLLLWVLILATGCQSILQLTYKNEDFNWVSSSNLAKIVIQSTRDKGFRYVITDGDTISELHEFLSSAMPMEKKQDLGADYVFEFHSYDNKIKKYSYVAGVNNQNTGNFYDEKGTYLVLNSIDQHLIKNLFSLRKPQDFTRGYYGSILEAAKVLKKDFPSQSLGISIGQDREMLKFQTSKENLDFNVALNQQGILPIKEAAETDLGAVVQTMGYKPELYKALVEVKDNKSVKTYNYYVVSNYKNGQWKTTVTKEEPKDF